MFKDLPITSLRESATNPRKHFDPAKLAELTASIKGKGVLVPLLVRPVNGHHEIVAGARRFRGAQAAGLSNVPVRIVDLDDKQTLEVQIIENAQREDVHPLEEARAYQQLIDEHGYDVPAIASKVGKSETYVYGRLILARLLPAAQEAFEKEEITAGHAALIARLDKKDQAPALKFCLEGNRWSDERVTVTELRRWIRDELQMELKRAPFQVKDKNLGAVACSECPKNTAANPTLFDDEDAKEAHCTDRACYDTKLDNWINRNIQKGLVQLSAEYGAKAPEGVLGSGRWQEPYDKSEKKSAESGIIVIGHRKGQVVKFTRPKASKGQSEEAKRQRETKIQREARRRIVTAILDAFDEKVEDQARLSFNDLRLVAMRVFDESGQLGRKFVDECGWVKKGEYRYQETVLKKTADLTGRGLETFILHMALLPFCEVFTHGDQKMPPELLEVASRYGVPARTIEREVREEKAPKAKKKAKKKPTNAN